MMPLHTPIPRSEIEDEPERFDWLAGLLDKVARVDEVHADEGDDSCYIFLVWLEPAATHELGTIAERILATKSDGWQYHVACLDGVGFLVVYTWIA